MTRLEKTASSFIKPSYKFVKSVGVSMYKIGDETFYDLTIHVDPKYLEWFFELNPNFIDATGKLKKDLLDRPFTNFTQIANENDYTSVARSKNVTNAIKKDFYLARKMSGIDYPTGAVSLRIVFD